MIKGNSGDWNKLEDILYFCFLGDWELWGREKEDEWKGKEDLRMVISHTDEKFLRLL